MSILMTIVKMALTGLSFAGLCGLVRDWLRLEPSFAPLATASGIIIALMLSGVAHVLFPAWLALYAAGFISLVWRYGVRRCQVDWLVVAVLGMCVIFCFFHFRKAYYTGNDSVSHWGMVMKYLLRTNRFPDSSTQLIYFQTYPLGSSVFLYYLCRGVAESEGAYMGAMFLLYVIALLPLLAFVRRNKVVGFVIAGLAAAVMTVYGSALSTIQVDRLLGLLGFGATAMLCYYYEDPKRALPATAAVAAALALVKASGVFFSALIAGMMLLTLRRKGASFRERFLAFLILAVAIGLALGLWQIHLKFAYPNAGHSKHAVSVESYAASFHEKTPELVWSILRKMLSRLIHPGKDELAGYAACVTVFAAMIILVRFAKQERVVWQKRLVSLLIFSVAVYAMWYALLFLMYIFSMPVEEARYLASIMRYESSVMVLVMGWQALFLIAFVCRQDAVFSRTKCIAVVCGMLIVTFALIAGTSQGKALAKRLLKPESSRPRLFAGLLNLREQQDIEEECSYLIFALHDEIELQTALYVTKYEFFSNEIMEIGSHLNAIGYDPTAYYTFQNVYAHNFDCEEITNLRLTIEKYIDQYEYVLVYSKDEVFESALNRVLENYTGNTQVYYAY